MGLFPVDHSMSSNLFKDLQSLQLGHGETFCFYGDL